MNVYLDNNATTQPLSEVVEAMLPFLKRSFGNPSSLHCMGLEARKAVEKARDAVAAMIHAKTPTEIVFSSCATESITHAFQIACRKTAGALPPIVVSSVEHTAVLEAAERYESEGSLVTTIAVDSEGGLDLHQLEEAISGRSAFVSVMLANNETGVVFPLISISEMCKHHGALLHIDAVQAAGKLLIDVQNLNCDYLSLSAHKFHGPKGVGALYIREGAPRAALIRGHQENHLRGGTENVAGVVGMGAAAEAVPARLNADISRVCKLRDALESEILSSVSGSKINGSVKNRLCNTTNIFFPNKNSADLVDRFSGAGVYVSAGAACTTGGKPSHVLRAMGLGEDRANASIRFSLAKTTTQQEVNCAVKLIPKIIESTMSVFSVA